MSSLIFQLDNIQKILFLLRSPWLIAKVQTKINCGTAIANLRLDIGNSRPGLNLLGSEVIYLRRA
jgi:hypothetical protein